MRSILIIFFSLLWWGCSEPKPSSTPSEDRIELVPEPDKEQRLGYEKNMQNNTSLRLADFMEVNKIHKVEMTNSSGTFMLSPSQLEHFKNAISSFVYDSEQSVKVGAVRMAVFIDDKQYAMATSTHGEYLEVDKSIVTKNQDVVSEKQELYFKIDGVNFDNYTKKELTNEQKEITSLVNEFFSWYIQCTKKHNEIFMPEFGKDKNGRATLHFDKYIDNLKRYHFSDSLIQKEIASYEPCLKNLQKTPYDEFQKWDGLDQYEMSNCDFGNQYRWSGGQEPIDTVKIVEFVQLDESNYTLKSARGGFISPEEGYSYTNDITLNVIKQKGVWKINNIDIL